MDIDNYTAVTLTDDDIRAAIVMYVGAQMAALRWGAHTTASFKLLLWQNER